MRADAGALSVPVIYVGTFSKTLYPGLRLGYVVLPPALVSVLRRANVRQFREGDYAAQAALAAFIDRGDFARHVARMRRLYRERQTLLRRALSVDERPLVAFEGGDTGMHLVAKLSSRAVERDLVQAGQAAGVALAPLSSYFSAGSIATPGLVLGYANCDADEIAQAGGWLRARLEAMVSDARRDG